MANIFAQYLIWHFRDCPKEIFKAWKNFLAFYLDYFSVPLLLQTFFWHWHKYYYSYGKAFDPARFFEAFVFNMMSRIVGAILRAFFIVVGIISEIIIFFFGIAILIGWLILPLVLIFGFAYGVILILNVQF
jgi:hypothetical protein